MTVLNRFVSPHAAFAATAARAPHSPFLLAPASAALPYARDGFRYDYLAINAHVDDTIAVYARAGYPPPPRRQSQGIGARIAMTRQNAFKEE